MLKTMQSAERDAIFAVADLMAAAAKTAPKGSGRDTIVTAIVSGETKDQLRDKLTELGTKYEEAFMVRDAGNVDNSTCVLLIGCTDTYMGLNQQRSTEVPVFLMFQTLVSPLALRSVLPRIIGSITA